MEKDEAWRCSGLFCAVTQISFRTVTQPVLAPAFFCFFSWQKGGQGAGNRFTHMYHLYDRDQAA